MRNIKLGIAYDGTNYCGWQVQPNGVSVAGEILKAIKTITGESPSFYGSGRTDAGVHALCQTANFYTESKIEPYRMIAALNANLPADIRIIEASEADMDFNARFSAVGKTYCYRIVNAKILSPFEVNRAWLIKYGLDVEKMRAAAAMLVGEHDFKAFQSTGSYVTNTVRTISRLDVEKEGELITITVTGNGFLYNMVRIITGTLVYAGCGRVGKAQIEKMLNELDRTKGGITAPACGLYLKEVYYQA